MVNNHLFFWLELRKFVVHYIYRGSSIFYTFSKNLCTLIIEKCIFDETNIVTGIVSRSISIFVAKKLTYSERWSWYNILFIAFSIQMMFLSYVLNKLYEIYFFFLVMFTFYILIFEREKIFLSNQITKKKKYPTMIYYK